DVEHCDLLLFNGTNDTFLDLYFEIIPKKPLLDSEVLLEISDSGVSLRFSVSVEDILDTEYSASQTEYYLISLISSSDLDVVVTLLRDIIWVFS
ncbi:15392_t:CDS:1, partial [Acaulospora morrowiae]